MAGKKVEELDEDDLRALIDSILDMYQKKYGAYNSPKTTSTGSTDKTNLPPAETHKKRRINGQTPTIATQNRFEALLEIDNPQMDTDDNNESHIQLQTDSNTQTSTTANTKLNNRNNQHQSSTDTSPATKTKTEEDRKPKIAPIIITDTTKWIQASQLMKNKKISSTKCKLIQTGIQVDPATEDDYRKLSKVLKDEQVQFYTYQLRSEKKLKVVLRGITQEISEEMIKEDLRERDYPIEKIVRMKGKNGLPAPLVLIEINRDYKSIYNITECCGLDIKVEPLRTRNAVIQCHKCQMFGHTQLNCNINHRCMKCGEAHSTHLCTKPRTTPAKCANCGGEHVSTSLKCPNNPNNPSTKKYIEAPLPKDNPWTRRREDITTKRNNEPHQKTHESQETKHTTANTKSDQLALILGRMVLNFNRTNATTEQRLEFLKHTQELTDLHQQ